MDAGSSNSSATSSIGQSDHMQFSNRPHSDAAVLTENKPTASEVRKKRHRTTFSPSQLHVLEEAFARQQYLVGTERVRLAALLNIGVAQIFDVSYACSRLFKAWLKVKVWFQNRRIRWRREQRQVLMEREASDIASGKTNSSNSQLTLTSLARIPPTTSPHSFSCVNADWLVAASFGEKTGITFVIRAPDLTVEEFRTDRDC
ncbi:hypothetical protein Q1695_011727 [Nippostrongylus brasiliensis]|nr:hypothetical protein Q1695_011727 [Nippostrongylus brasiliensis]